MTVVGAAPLLRTETASLGQVIDQEKIVGLPLNGRTFITLAGLAPGVALPPGSLLPRINGGRPRTNEYLFDGISVLQPEPGQVAFFPIIDSIQEFKVESNSPPAEFGRFNGGVDQPHHPVRQQRVSRHRLRVLPARRAERPQLSSSRRIRSSRPTAAISSAACSAGRSAGTRRSSSSTTRASGRRSAAR